MLERQGVRFLFTLCGGHISPILVGAKARGIKIVDTRHEANAVFAADAVSRLTGVPGVAAVTAGPGVTNTITAIKNAQLAHSPVIVLGGATATILKGRGSLQDIDQMALVEPHVKMAAAVTRVKDLPGTLEKAFEVSMDGVPGPVFIECPVDLLYDEGTVREMFGAKSASDVRSLPDVALQLYLRYYLAKTFAGAKNARASARRVVARKAAFPSAVARAAKMLATAKKPVIVVGSQATLGGPDEANRVAEALERLAAPVYLSGMARGLMGKAHDIWYRHKRRKALGEADFVLLAGVPNDFRLNYGLHISRKATLVSVNRSEVDVRKNRRPKLGAVADPGDFIIRLSREFGGDRSAWRPWLDRLRTRDREREDEIEKQAQTDTDFVNPLRVCQGIERAMADDSVLVADGGDFVATASYITSPRSPLSWLDPGPFGTLGVGAGLCHGGQAVPARCGSVAALRRRLQPATRWRSSTRSCATSCRSSRWWATTRAGPRSPETRSRSSRTTWGRCLPAATTTPSPRALAARAWCSTSPKTFPGSLKRPRRSRPPARRCSSTRSSAAPSSARARSQCRDVAGFPATRRSRCCGHKAPTHPPKSGRSRSCAEPIGSRSWAGATVPVFSKRAGGGPLRPHRAGRRRERPRARLKLSPPSGCGRLLSGFATL